jgi:hypothetical protein
LRRHTAFGGVLSDGMQLLALVQPSLDQSFKQLPARHKIGVFIFSAYAKAADCIDGNLYPQSKFPIHQKLRFVYLHFAFGTSSMRSR